MRAFEKMATRRILELYRKKVTKQLRNLHIDELSSLLSTGLYLCIIIVDEMELARSEHG